MKELKIYQCEHCRTQYQDKEQCVECECFHDTELEIEAKHYQNIKCSQNPFPIRIVIVNKNGRVASYRRE